MDSKFLGKFFDFRFVSRFLIGYKSQPGVKEASSVSTDGNVLLCFDVAVVVVLFGVHNIFTETLEANFCASAYIISLLD